MDEWVGRLAVFATISLIASCSRDTDLGAAPKSVLAFDGRSRECSGALLGNSAGYVHIPGNVMVHADCLWQVPSGAFIGAGGEVTLNNRVVMPAQACPHKPCLRGQDKAACGETGAPPGDNGGWVAWDAANPPAPYTEFNALDSGHFTVPSAPSPGYDGQNIFLFPSLQTESGWIVRTGAPVG